MLGAWIAWENGQATAFLTEKALKKHTERFDKEHDNIHNLLGWAKLTGFAAPRLEGVQAFLRLQSYLEGWAKAYAICEDTAVVLEDGRWRLAQLRDVFAITAQEMKDATDRWTQVRFKPYGG